MEKVTVIGAGLAGSEAAYQLAKRGIPVRLWEMKRLRKQPAHTEDTFAELVCSNSLRSDRLQNAVGLLKEEMRRLDSLIMQAADATRVPAGGALAVDRHLFSDYVTQRLKAMPQIEIVEEECRDIPEGPCILASGPLTDGELAQAIAARCSGFKLHFHDAVAPIISFDSIDMEKAFFFSRYDRGSDYINCPMNQQEYDAFYDALVGARLADLHEFDRDANIFEGCMPVEVMAGRGRMTLAFGPLKPVGILDPHTGKRPYAVVQLRRENAEGTYYNMVGFQTRLAWPEQKRVFSLIPGLENAEFLRYGVMHRNTYLDSPGFLQADYSVAETPELYFAGQITGVEGYVESAASGMTAGISLARRQMGLPPIDFTGCTVIGSMGQYVSRGLGGAFVPMNANFGLMDPLQGKIHGKKNRQELYVQRALSTLENLVPAVKGEFYEV
ncbi:MAG: methylenetetrahydrofolate--tRNA-(uracil(54)-C(5))-methyltransferase (FADH(2)-oxidizing) TrmFO [Eubacteriales bacterium]|nr:methylenetetrahydrofolate--tRNA-(uracil(54)-C(5))-methyltransferase (FADH(2)-oxidizing) TrmFO [Eubacteriales bacterium]